jgi:hypothetical protein
VTGAFMAWASLPAAETDGPVGAAAVAHLCNTLRIRATVVTDDLCADVVAACLEYLRVDAALKVVPHDATTEEVQSSASTWSLSHVMAVERLGPAADGRVRTMRSLDNTAFTAPLHVLFLGGNLATSAIGDGGNEIGMGRLPSALIAANVPGGERIACRVPADHLLVAGTSNWGCYGFISAMALIDRACGRTAYELLDYSTDEGLIAAALSAGAIDGVTGRAEATVDGIPVDDYRPMMETLQAIVDDGG